MEKEYPEMTQAFKDLQHEQYELFCKKQFNYGPGNIAQGTTLSNEEDRKISLMGLFFRINDKVQRIKQLVLLNRQDTANESVKDTFNDLSVYGIIAQVVILGKWGK